MRLVTFNAWSVGNRNIADNLTRLAVASGNPEVIACQEMKKYRGTIPGYDRVAIDEGHPENANCVMFLRIDGLSFVRNRSLFVDGPTWVGPKHGIKHPPRRFVGATAAWEDGVRWDLLNVHRTPGGPYPHIKVNGESWAAEHRALIAWVAGRMDRHPDRPLAMLGDWNNRRLDKRDRSVSHLARRVDGRLLLKGIDGAVLVNSTGKARRMKSTFGSDGHRPIVITATKENQ